MDRWERDKRDRQLEKDRDAYLSTLADLGLRPPDEIETTWAKWREGDTQVIVRFGIDGSATLDAYWTESDGIGNAFIAPKDVRSTAWLARDIARILADPGRETTISVGRPDPISEAGIVLQNDDARAVGLANGG